MHQALYRKWRPKTFDDVFGQDHITSILKYETKHAQFSHAYLFCGSRGTGKTTCAKILAKAVNCENPIDGNPCGKCACCMAIENNTTTDVVEMDAASNNGVENIRAIRDEVSYVPTLCKYRVYIVDEVHMLSGNAFNALLKTLEEPPAHIIFILATTEIHKLLPTIVSRCQRYDFRRIAMVDLMARMKMIATAENIELTEEGATLLARRAQGGMRDAISLLEMCAGTNRPIDAQLVADTIGITGRDVLVDTVTSIVKKDYQKLFEIIKNLVSSAKELPVYWQELIGYYRDIMVIKTVNQADDFLDYSDAERKELRQLADCFSKEQLLYQCSLLNDALQMMQRTGAIAETVAELTLVRMCTPEMDTSVEALTARIAALESREWTADNSRETKQTQRDREPKPEDKKTDVTSAPSLKNEEKPKQSSTTSGAVRPMKEWAEVIELAGRQDAMLTSLLKKTCALIRNHKLVLQSSSDFYLQSLQNENTLTQLCALCSTVLHCQITKGMMIFEKVDTMPEQDGLADLIHMAESEKNETNQ